MGFCLLAGSGAARDISSGDTIFDYEVVTLNTSLGTPGPYSSLAKYPQDDITGYPILTIPLTEGNGSKTLDLTAFEMQGNYGTYFPVYADGPNSSYRIYIREPLVTLDLVPNASRIDSVAGKTISKNTPLAFKIVMPYAGTSLKDQASVSVELTTPSGAKITRVGSVDLSNVLINSSTMYLSIPVDDVKTLDDGTYTAQAKWESPQSFSNYASPSNSVSFTLRAWSLRIWSNKESVVRNNLFDITLIGDSKKDYYLYIKNASVKADEYPFIMLDQPSVTLLGSASFPGSADANAGMLANGERARAGGVYVPSTAAVIKTKADGTRTVEFGTSTSTSERTFVFKVLDPTNSSIYDEVKVAVEKGEVTITAEGTGTYYLGEEIKLSGTNTDSEKVYLFLVGPGLHPGGVSLIDATKPASGGNYVERDVESDDTWGYRWDTSNLAETDSTLDTGTYTIYAVSAAKDATGANVTNINLSGVRYSTFVVVLYSGEEISLSPGWNFISVPKTLAAGNNTAAIFSGINTSGHSALRYDAAGGRWVALKATDTVAPLEGIWIYAVEPTTIPLRFSPDLPASPAERALSKGWNAVGASGVPSASARDTLLSLGGKWTTLIGFDPARQTFETAVVNGGSGEYADSRQVYSGRGYWLYMTELGTLCSLTV